MITLASIAKARHVYASVGTEAKMEIQRDAVYWMLTHTEIESTTELRAISQDFVECMPYDWFLDTWEALKKEEVTFCLLKRTFGQVGELYLELEAVDTDDPWPNKIA